MESWKEVSQVSIEGSDAKVTKYKALSGLTLVLIDLDGPIVNTSIVLATEAHDNDGLPHTLEHLIFLGSEDYPYNGLIDIYANQYSSAINALTSVSYTSYALNSAGPSGTLKMLPIYMDHILYPLLTDEGFVTEVHHVNEKGEDGGVVYSEMQGGEGSFHRRIERELGKEMYPGSGYSSVSVGMLKNLRNSTSIEKIRKYHQENYRAENISIIIAGKVDKESIFESLNSVEEKIKKKTEQTPATEYIRPWQTPLSPLTVTKVIHLDYPSEVEDTGHILVGFRGPRDLNNCYEYIAFGILVDYLCQYVWRKALVEIDNPFAGNISYELLENCAMLLMITLENVPLTRLNSAVAELQNNINSLISNSEFLNINKIKLIIESKLKEFQYQMESSPDETLTNLCIYDMLFSTNEQQFAEKLNKYKLFKNLNNEDTMWWENLYKKYLLQSFVAVVGHPKTNLANQLSDEEDERVKEQKRLLGENGLKKLGEDLQNAIQFNDREAPIEMRNSVFVPDIDNLKKFTYDKWESNDAECPYFNIKQLPFYAQVYNIRSQFSYITLLLDTSRLETNDRLYLPLMLKVLTQTSYMRNEQKIEFDVLKEEIKYLTKHLSMKIGTEDSDYSDSFEFGTFYNTIKINAICEHDKCDKVVDLIWHILNKTIFERKRVLTIAQDLINEITQLRSEDQFMAKMLITTLTTKKDTNQYSANILQQQKFLSDAISILKKGDTDESKSFLNSLENTRSKITRNGNMCLHFAADIKNHQYSLDPWMVFGSAESTHNPYNLENQTYLNQLVDSNEIEGQGCIVGIGATESSCLILYCKGPTSYSDPDLPALKVAIQYLQQNEGPLWKSLRGSGLVYSFLLSVNPTNGWISFELGQASHIAQAYEKAKALTEPFFTTNVWDENLFLSAKNSLIFTIIELEKSKPALLEDTLSKFMCSLDNNYNRTLCKAIAAVTKQEAFEAAKKWFPDLFSSKNIIVVASNPSKMEEIKDYFESLGRSGLKMFKTLEEMDT